LTNKRYYLAIAIPDIDFDFTNEEDVTQVTYPNKSRNMSVSIGKLVSSRNAISSEVNEVIDRATEFGYELGVMEEQQRFAEMLEAMLKRAEAGDVVLTEALLELSKMVVKDDDATE
jgi:hypothetical protein